MEAGSSARCMSSLIMNTTKTLFCSYHGHIAKKELFLGGGPGVLKPGPTTDITWGPFWGRLTGPFHHPGVGTPSLTFSDTPASLKQL